jgi:hypothetical protein
MDVRQADAHQRRRSGRAAPRRERGAHAEELGFDSCRAAADAHELREAWVQSKSGRKGKRPCLTDDAMSLLERLALLEARVRLGCPGLKHSMLIVPLDRVRLRAPKCDAVLREQGLRAVHAQQTILSRMVVFFCRWCRERFPTFHPAYIPPQKLGMQLLSSGGADVSRCNIEVAWWDEVPPEPSALPSDSQLATVHWGVCKACSVDIAAEKAKLGTAMVSARSVVPKRPFLNSMDPMHRFPQGRWLQDLFDSVTLPEAMLLALEHLQV